ncbi:PRMT5-domain-containing protein [Dendrothele bispora CBS 962.96]|uniref:Protein arginine N-methyltransferase n=1 Tax=Dendrothele bispora (strain CBS 962.96) TaxID=1314807 RepID=A0A4S8MKB3_DENBC|nr:PRMT5-domain-containing protein [Dendrothele bispora CBS 962.96]
MSSWNPSQYSSISAHLTLSDISQVQTTESHETPILGLTSDAREKGYDGVCLPLTTDAWKKRWTNMCLVPSSSGDERKKRESRRESKLMSRDATAEKKAEVWRAKPVFEADEVTMTRLDEAEGSTAIISEWLELDTDDDWIRFDAEIALQQELSYASYLNIQTAILPAPRNRQYATCYARVVNACLQSSPFMNLAIRLPVYDPNIAQDPLSPTSSLSGRSLLSSPTIQRSSSLGSSLPSTPRLVVSQSLQSTSHPKTLEEHIDASWETWDLIRSLCDYNPRLSLALDLTPPLPNSPGVLGKWSAEAVRYIFLPASTFIANAKGYPVLPKPTQIFIRDSMAHRPNIILSGVSSGIHAKGTEAAYSQYIRHLERTSPVVQAAEKSGTVENFAQGYQDYLQAPLQPLMDNLQSITYQTFEQDPVKYKNYEEVIATFSGFSVVCVAGAGRGPLVARCLSAIQRSNREAFIYAVEKNPNAFVTLQGRQRNEWKDKVQLLFGDMRMIELPEQVDILVSELLGSFGDNELSPECLDGAMRLLKPDGISIPSSYTAHLAPLSSSKLYNEARSTKDDKNLEIPYVVMFQAVNLLSGNGGGPSGQCGPQIQECWEFEHPRKETVLNSQGLPLTNSHNSRFAKLRFHIPHAGVLHGLAGYFEAVLYRNIGLSIHPHRKDQISKDMLSWFPLFFPFKEPLYLPSNSELQVSIWRLTNQRQVWYEWHAESFLYGLGSDIGPTSNPSTPPIPMSNAGVPVTASPLIDAVDIAPERRTSVVLDPFSTRRALIKIGHTSLHNAGGRSSWIGL